MVGVRFILAHGGLILADFRILEPLDESESDPLFVITSETELARPEPVEYEEDPEAHFGFQH